MSIKLTRRQFLSGLVATGLVAQSPQLFATRTDRLITRPISASGKSLPVIGMGTWRTFNVGSDSHLIAQRTLVLKAFFEHGGRLIDSSPMYGSAEAVLGQSLATLGHPEELFAATKIWTSDQQDGIREAAESRQLWGIDKFELLQIHNLLGWQGHMETLKEMKASSKVAYIGITTSHGRRHREFEDIMAREPIDFVQLTYNVLDREVEERLLPLAQERGIAVIANRPFQGGQLFSHVQSQPLPEWGEEVGCKNWAEFFLKYIVSHPAVTCAIPATTSVEHMVENMGAQFGLLPDAAQRVRMARFIQSL